MERKIQSSSRETVPSRVESKESSRVCENYYFVLRRCSHGPLSHHHLTSGATTEKSSATRNQKSIFLTFDRTSLQFPFASRTATPRNPCTLHECRKRLAFPRIGRATCASWRTSSQCDLIRAGLLSLADSLTVLRCPCLATQPWKGNYIVHLACPARATPLTMASVVPVFVCRLSARRERHHLFEVGGHDQVPRQSRRRARARYHDGEFCRQFEVEDSENSSRWSRRCSLSPLLIFLAIPVLTIPVST